MKRKVNPLLMTDGYKTGHHLMYHPGTEVVYSNFTCRSTKRMPDEAKDVVVFGIQYMLQYIKELWDENFFSQPKEEVCGEAKKYLSDYLMSEYDVSHFEALHNLGYLPIEVKSLDEGSIINQGLPLFTIKNTKKEFFWVTNFLETLISTTIWKPVHSASLALAYRKVLTHYAKETDKDNLWVVDYQAHDFSFRGMQSYDSAISSGLGFATAFKGSDTVPVLKASTHYYNDLSSINSVNATEHSVMCSGSKEGELETFRRLLKTFPTGILSVVSDTWDLWKVLTEYLPELKEEILARDGKLVIRPDSGDPVDIICGDAWRVQGFTEGVLYKVGDGGTVYNYIDNKYYTVTLDDNYKVVGIPIEDNNDVKPNEKGAIELLWDVFGGTVNEQGYKVLDSHIGLIYGDAITIDRAVEICERLKAKGFASTNVVFGVGSYSMGYATRDNQGGAVKSTYVEIDGKGVPIFKDPITDSGEKKSAVGLLMVDENYQLINNCTPEQERSGLLTTIFKDGEFTKRTTLSEIRSRVLKNL